MRRQYKNPPIVEAVVGLSFERGPDWDPTIPGRLYEQLKDKYDAKPQQNVAGNFMTVVGDQGQTAQVQVSLSLKSGNGNFGIEVGQHGISAHTYHPYDSWEAFSERVVEMLNSFQDLATGTLCSRIGVRYINRMVFPEDITELSAYLKSLPVIPDGIPDSVFAFHNVVACLYPDNKDELKMQTASADADGSLALFLDLDVSAPNLGMDVANTDAILAVVNRLRERERNAFESCITDKARALFILEDQQ